MQDLILIMAAGGQDKRLLFEDVNKTFGITTLDLRTYIAYGLSSLVETLKKGDGRSGNNNDVDFTYAKLTIAPDKATLYNRFGIAYYQDDTDGGVKATAGNN